MIKVLIGAISGFILAVGFFAFWQWNLDFANWESHQRAFFAVEVICMTLLGGLFGNSK